jgi:hypothetical protein
MSPVIMTAADGKNASISPDADTKSDFPQTEPKNAEESKLEGDSPDAPESAKATQLLADENGDSPKKDSEEEQTDEEKSTSTPKVTKGKYPSNPLHSERVF